MRNRLIELLNEAFIKSDDNFGMPNTNQVADYLLENGVVVPPCKVGDTVYCLIDENNELDCRSKHICTSEVEEFSIVQSGGMQWVVFHLDFWNTDINPRTLCVYVADCLGKTVFLTKEEAEAKLKEIVENG